MKHIIIGTAGHIDHGKTELIRALTGIDTDRLKEEKKRGITIELGFAKLTFDDGTVAGIVDVPGHEHFIKAMMAGAGGMDCAMLIIAADEGCMPQTIEHINILSLLGVKNGIVVITKTDLVDEDWMEMLREDIKGSLRGTIFEGKPVVEVSSVTGAGIPELKNELYRMVNITQNRPLNIPFRLPVDRVFTVSGFGTVVTGTLIEGVLEKDGKAVVAPRGKETVIRGIQVHGIDVDKAFAGQRVAINLSRINTDEIDRGDSICCPESIKTTDLVDVKLINLSDSKRIICNQMRVHLYVGTREVVARISLLNAEELLPGESAYAQIRTEEKIAVKKNDRFIIRFYSPVETIGGGFILDETPCKHKRYSTGVTDTLYILEKGNNLDKLEAELIKERWALPFYAELEANTMLYECNMQKELLDSGKAMDICGGRLVSKKVFDNISDFCCKILNQFHRENPLLAGMNAAELKQKAFEGIETQVHNLLLDKMCELGIIKAAGSRFALGDFTPDFSAEQEEQRAYIIKKYTDMGIEPVSTEELIESSPWKDKNSLRMVIAYLIDSGMLISIGDGYLTYKDILSDFTGYLKEYFSKNEEISLSQIRDTYKTSRKYALMFLEYTDAAHYTKRVGEIRKAGYAL